MMALEPIPYYSDLFNMILFDETINATHCSFSNNFVTDNGDVGGDSGGNGTAGGGTGLVASVFQPERLANQRVAHGRGNSLTQGRKKRRRRAKTGLKNKEVAENQRMTHITVERNRRKLMNDHLSVLKSLMPESYAQRGDQASIVGGAIEYVKELEHLVHSLEAGKHQHLNHGKIMHLMIHDTPTMDLNNFNQDTQCISSQTCNKYISKCRAETFDIEVTLIETHANIRILSKKTRNQLSKLVSGLQTLGLIVLHLSVTSMEPFILYSISAKVAEGCQLTSADGIAEAVHHMLRIFEEDVCPTHALVLST